MTHSRIKHTLSHWLYLHPIIKPGRLNAEAGLPDKTLYRYLKGQRNFPEKHKEALKKVLIKYGYTGKI